MRNQIKASFVKHFMGGFALGAIALVASQVAHAQPSAALPVTMETIG